MPFVRTAVRQGTDASQKQLIVESIHNALVQAIGMPEDELFNLVSEYNASDFLYSRTFNGVARSDHLVVVEITMRRGRSDAMKKALYAEIAANLEKRAGISSKDVFIFTHENDYSDWSVGNGQFAMVLVQQGGSDLSLKYCARALNRDCAYGSNSEVGGRYRDVRFTSESRLKSDIAACPKGATSRLMRRSIIRSDRHRGQQSWRIERLG